MNDLVGCQKLDNQISQFNKIKLQNEFEKSVEGFYKSINPRVSFENNLETQSKNDSEIIQKKESFTNDFINTADEVYLISIRNDIESILRILENVECFSAYKSYWNDLRLI